jgi:dual specificity protein kinase YAK1
MVFEALIEPSEPTSQSSLDNTKGELIVRRGSEIRDPSNGKTYRIEGSLGSGQFGQVYHVLHINPDDGSPRPYAVKISRSNSSALEQFEYEAVVLDYLRTEPENISSYQSSFIYESHYCILLDLLGKSVFQSLRDSGFNGMPLGQVQMFLSQILQALSHLHRLNLVHLDVKPENILFEDSSESRVRLIDYGNCCSSGDPSITYAQTRYYRSPEMALGLSCSTSADIWSAGCVAAEMFLGLPIFAATSTPHLLDLMEERLGKFPECMQSQILDIRTSRAYAPVESRKIFRYSSLASIIREYSPKGNLKLKESRQYMEQKAVLLDLLLQMLEFDPDKRITAATALSHPFFKLAC